MNKLNLKAVKGRCSMLASRAAVGALAMAATPLAFAAADPGAAILAEVNTAATTVGGILVVLAGVVGMFILWSYLKRAR